MRAGYSLWTGGWRATHACLPDVSETLDSHCEAPCTKAIAANERRIVAPLVCETGILMVTSFGPNVETPTEAAWRSRPADCVNKPSRAKQLGPIRARVNLAEYVLYRAIVGRRSPLYARKVKEGRT